MEPRPTYPVIMTPSKRHEFLRKYLLSSVAATFAETVTFPLDITKTRLQTQGERASMVSSGGSSVAYRGMVKTAVGIVNEEGVFKLWNGLKPAVLRHIIYTGSRMTVYEFLRNRVLKRNEDGRFPVWKSIISGMTAGAFGQFFSSPADLVKVQMQMEGKRVLVEKRKPRVQGTLHAFRSIIKDYGIKGLWKGWLPNVQRACLVNMGDLTTYDTVKHNLLKHTSLQDNWITHTMSSACSGLVAATISTPADVIKTRIMNNPSGYKGAIDCFKRTERPNVVPYRVYYAANHRYTFSICTSHYTIQWLGETRRIFFVIQGMATDMDEDGSMVLDFLAVVREDKKIVRGTRILKTLD